MSSPVGRDGREEEGGHRGPRLSHARRGEVELVGGGGRVTGSERQSDFGKYFFNDPRNCAEQI